MCNNLSERPLEINIDRNFLLFIKSNHMKSNSLQYIKDKKKHNDRKRSNTMYKRQVSVGQTCQFLCMNFTQTKSVNTTALLLSICKSGAWYYVCMSVWGLSMHLLPMRHKSQCLSVLPFLLCRVPHPKFMNLFPGASG